MLKIVKFSFNIKKQSIKTPKNPNSSAMIARIKSVWASVDIVAFVYSDPVLHQKNRHYQKQIVNVLAGSLIHRGHPMDPKK